MHILLVVFKLERISNMQPVRGIQIEWEHARLIKFRENPLKNHATPKTWYSSQVKLQLLITRSNAQFPGGIPIELHPITYLNILMVAKH